MENKAVFKIDSYHFVEASLNFDIPEKASLDIQISPSGVYFQSQSRYELNFIVRVKHEETQVVYVNCKAKFSFREQTKFEEIPDFFYPNCLAIVFPYVRAFVSTITLQANMNPVVLPTLNLMGLKDELLSNTKCKK